jgi:hypothetical protein
MTQRSDEAAQLKAQILRDPDAVLEDKEVMRALISAGGARPGRNVVDLRGVLVERLENRLDRLEDTHRTVIAAAYENLAGTNQIHRAVLALLDATSFEGFLHAAGTLVPQILSIDVVRIALETPMVRPGTPLGPAGEHHRLIVALEAGGVEQYFGGSPPGPKRAVLLRQSLALGSVVYGEDAAWIRSEALIRLDLGRGKRPGLMLFAAEDPHRFGPDQGTDLLTFFGGVFERVVRRFLA